MARGNGQGLFASRVEQALGLQFHFQGFKCLLQRPQAGRFQVFYDDLEVTPVLVEGHLAANADLVAFFRQGANTLIRPAKHGAADLAFLVFQ